MLASLRQARRQLRVHGAFTQALSSKVGGADSSETAPAPTRPGIHRTPIVDTLWRQREGAAAEVAADLVAKTPAASSLSVNYAFATDPVLRELYCNPWGKVRVGKVVEDLDALAGSIART